MKKTVRIYIGLLVVLGFLMLGSGCRKVVPLGEYQWESLGNNKSQIVVKSDRKLIVGPGMIELWAQYPWLFGQISNPPPNCGGFFVLNIPKKEVVYVDSIYDFFHENRISVQLNELVTFQDLMGQYGSDLLLARLQKIITPPENRRAE